MTFAFGPSLFSLNVFHSFFRSPPRLMGTFGFGMGAHCGSCWLVGVVAAGVRGHIGVGLWLWSFCVSVVWMAAFQIAKDFIGPFGYHKLHHKAPVYRMGIYVVVIFSLSPWWSDGGYLGGRCTGDLIYIRDLGLGWLCAAAGHAVDTSVARGKWVFFFLGFCLWLGYGGVWQKI